MVSTHLQGSISRKVRSLRVALILAVLATSAVASSCSKAEFNRSTASVDLAQDYIDASETDYLGRLGGEMELGVVYTGGVVIVAAYPDGRRPVGDQHRFEFVVVPERKDVIGVVEYGASGRSPR
jgi:hypothetical protein